MPAPQLLLPGDEEEAGGAGLSHEDFLNQFAPAEKKGALESFARGGAQGLSARFADEITGGLESLTTGKSYAQARDESRAQYKQAEKDNPLAYKAGEAVGGLASIFLPGGNLVKGAGLANAAARGALYGGAAGLGGSESDLTRGDVGGVARDTLGGAATGAAFGAGVGLVGEGLRRILAPAAKAAGERIGQEAETYASERLSKAQRLGDEEMAKESERFAPLLEREPEARAAAAASPEVAAEAGSKRLTQTALDRLKIEAGNKQKIQVFGRRGVNEQGIKDVLAGDRELRAAIDVGGEPGVSVGTKPFEKGTGPDAALDIVAKRMETEGARLDQIYDAAQGETAGVNLKAMLGHLTDLKKEYDKVGATAPLGKAVGAEIKRLQAQYKGVDRVPLQEVRQQYRGWQDLGYSGGGQFTVSATKQLQRDMANALRTALQDEIESVGEKNPQLKTLLPELRATNKRVQALNGIETLLDEWSTRKSAGAPTMGEMTLNPLKAIRNAVERKAFDVGRSAIGSAAAAAARRGPSAAMARLMNAARAGAVNAAVVNEAIQAGVPQDVVDDVVKRFGGDQ